MALETLKNVKEIGGYPILQDLEDQRPHDIDEQWRQRYGDNFVIIDHVYNVLLFRLQSGPIKEVGVNGCQVDTLIHAAKLILEGLNAKFPCRENALAITKLDEAIMWLEKRTKDREARGVEGTSNA